LHGLPARAGVAAVPDLLLPDDVLDAQPVGVGLGVLRDVPADLLVAAAGHGAAGAHHEVAGLAGAVVVGAGAHAADLVGQRELGDDLVADGRHPRGGAVEAPALEPVRDRAAAGAPAAAGGGVVVRGLGDLLGLVALDALLDLVLLVLQLVDDLLGVVELGVGLLGGLLQVGSALGEGEQPLAVVVRDLAGQGGAVQGVLGGGAHHHFEGGVHPAALVLGGGEFGDVAAGALVGLLDLGEPFIGLVRRGLGLLVDDELAVQLLFELVRLGGELVEGGFVVVGVGGRSGEQEEGRGGGADRGGGRRACAAGGGSAVSSHVGFLRGTGPEASPGRIEEGGARDAWGVTLCPATPYVIRSLSA